MKIIGIGGTNGSGKDTVGHMLSERHGWLFISTSQDLLIPELKRRNLPLEREQMSALTTEWRREHGKGVVLDKAVAKFKEESKKRLYNGLVLCSLRHPWEVDRLHDLGGMLVWVDADPSVRYQRVFSRKQGVKDQKNFEQFLEEEQREMIHHSGDKTTLNMAAVKAGADVFIQNNGNDIEKFKDEAQKALKNFL